MSARHLRAIGDRSPLMRVAAKMTLNLGAVTVAVEFHGCLTHLPLRVAPQQCRISVGFRMAAIKQAQRLILLRCFLRFEKPVFRARQAEVFA